MGWRTRCPLLQPERLCRTQHPGRGCRVRQVQRKDEDASYIPPDSELMERRFVLLAERDGGARASSVTFIVCLSERLELAARVL